MKIWNLNVKRGVDGSKHLDIQMHGVIDGGWYDEVGVDTADTIAELNQHRDAKTVRVGINSVGGAAFGGVAMYNALQDHPGEVTCCVEGLAASAASLVAMAGKTVMGKGAMLMIHPPAAMAMGNATDLRKTADVLDKIQDALGGIYEAKTGKSAEEIKGLINDETWMTADEAVASGFADEVMPDVKTDYGPGEQVPAEQEDEGDDGVEDRAPTMTADGLRWAGVVFPVTALPTQIVAMAKAPPPALAVVPPAAEKPPAPIVALEPVLARADLDRRAPELVKAMLGEGNAVGVAAERARLQAIDELCVKGCDELVVAAKYGDKPMTAAELAVAVVKAGKVAGADMLAIRIEESKVLAAVAAGAPDQTAATAEARHVNAMVAAINARRGENR